MSHVLAICAVVVVMLLKWQSIPTDSPDCRYYRRLAAGERVPRPYSSRILVPLVARLFRVELHNVCRVGNFALAVMIYLVALELGATVSQATAAALVAVGTESLFGAWDFLPDLVDSWSLALAGAAFLVPDPWAAGLLLLAALAKDSSFVLGGAWLLLLGSPWWILAPGAVAVAILIVLLPSKPADRDSLRRPIKEAWRQKRGRWFEYRGTLSGMHSTPFVAAAVLPFSPYSLPALALVGIASCQTLIAVDHSRLIALCLPWVVPVVALSVPDWALWPWVLSVLFWPLDYEVT